MAGIYIHIPFCKQACFYCDFHFSTNQALQKDLVEAICKELEIQKEYVGGESIETIYFGGGTPSMLAQSELNSILDSVSKNYSVTGKPEITLEANPDDLSLKKLQALKQSGINRLSIGVQSFDDTVLKFLNRAHNADEAERAISQAQDFGIENISIDLIYAIPNRGEALWLDDINKALKLAPKHISSYCLTIEPKTVFGHRASKGELQPMKDDVEARQFEILLEALDAEGFEQYEVSNFCLPGFESMHNSSYWKQQVYLGIGPSAHSYNRENRQYNVSHNKKYIDSIAKGIIPYTIDALSREDKVNDYLLTTLRTKWGADLSQLKSVHNYDLRLEQSAYVDRLLQNGLASLQDDHLILSKDGLLLADKISSDLFLVS